MPLTNRVEFSPTITAPTSSFSEASYAYRIPGITVCQTKVTKSFVKIYDQSTRFFTREIILNHEFLGKRGEMVQFLEEKNVRSRIRHCLRLLSKGLTY